MFLPIAIACASHVAGALLGLGGRRRSLAALRTFALVSALAVVLAQLLPDALGAAGLFALAIFAAGALAPTLIGKLAARVGRNGGKIGLELGFAGLLAHQLADGLALGAYGGEAHHDHGHGDVLLALSAHTVPLVALVTLVYQRQAGVAAAVVRAAALFVATLAGVLATALVPAAAFERFEPWITAAVAGLLLHVVVHDWEPERAPAGARERLVDLLAVAAGIGLVLLGGHDHHHESGDVRSGIGEALLELSLQTAPALLLGLAGGALLSAWASDRLPSRWLGGGAIRQAVVGASVGAPLPICACRVLPLAEGLRARGAGPALIVAFLIAAPVLGLETFALTGQLLGWPFAIVRLVAAVLLAIVAALAVHRAAPAPASHVCADHLPGGARGATFARRFLASFDELLVHIAPWTAVGLVAAAYVQATLGEGSLLALGGYGLDLLVVTLVAVPSYVCAAAATPLAAVLLAKGMSPGAVLVGLLLGPATNVATIGFLRASYGLRAAVIGVGTLILGAWAIALAVDASGVAVVPASLVAGEHEHGLAAYAVAVVLGVLLLRSIWRVGLRGWLASLGESLGAHDHAHHHHANHEHANHEHAHHERSPAVGR